jgi:hypothetical protein
MVAVPSTEGRAMRQRFGLGVWRRSPREWAHTND